MASRGEPPWTGAARIESQHAQPSRMPHEVVHADAGDDLPIAAAAFRMVLAHQTDDEQVCTLRVGPRNNQVVRPGQPLDALKVVAHAEKVVGQGRAVQRSGNEAVDARRDVLAVRPYACERRLDIVQDRRIGDVTGCGNRAFELGVRPRQWRRSMPRDRRPRRYGKHRGEDDRQTAPGHNSQRSPMPSTPSTQAAEEQPAEPTIVIRQSADPRECPEVAMIAVCERSIENERWTPACGTSPRRRPRRMR